MDCIGFAGEQHVNAERFRSRLPRPSPPSRRDLVFLNYNDFIKSFPFVPHTNDRRAKKENSNSHNDECPRLQVPAKTEEVTKKRPPTDGPFLRRSTHVQPERDSRVEKSIRLRGKPTEGRQSAREGGARTAKG